MQSLGPMDARGILFVLGRTGSGSRFDRYRRDRWARGNRNIVTCYVRMIIVSAECVLGGNPFEVVSAV